MELHTLGVHGDTRKRTFRKSPGVSRVGPSSIDSSIVGTFRFDPDQARRRRKLVLNRIPPGGGESDGDRVLEILQLCTPSTAHFVVTKIVRYFLGTPDADLG